MNKTKHLNTPHWLIATSKSRNWPTRLVRFSNRISEEGEAVRPSRPNVSSATQHLRGAPQNKTTPGKELNPRPGFFHVYSAPTSTGPPAAKNPSKSPPAIWTRRIEAMLCG